MEMSLSFVVSDMKLLQASNICSLTDGAATIYLPSGGGGYLPKIIMLN